MWYKRKAEVSPQEIRRHARQVLRFRKRVCANCGFDQYVETCHVKAVSSFGEDSTIAEINCPENLVFLCPNCHKLLDNGHLVFEFNWTIDDFEDHEVL